MTTDKPGEAAMRAATLICANYQLEDRWADNIATSVQAAIDEATAAVVAELESRDAALTSCKLTAGRWLQERNDARATARELATAVRKAGEMMKSVKIFVNNREKIKQPEGRELYDAAIADTEIALTKLAALLAEPDLSPEAAAKGEGGG